MKRLTLSGLALVLATSSGAALADRGHGDHYGKNYHGGYYHDRGHGYMHGHYKGHWYPRTHYRRVYYYPYHDHHSNYYPLGAALIGAAVTYSLVHTHETSYSEPAGSNEVVGCYRMERYPGGSERRVEVPLAECY